MKDVLSYLLSHQLYATHDRQRLIHDGLSQATDTPFATPRQNSVLLPLPHQPISSATQDFYPSRGTYRSSSGVFSLSHNLMLVQRKRLSSRLSDSSVHPDGIQLPASLQF